MTDASSECAAHPSRRARARTSRVNAIAFIPGMTVCPWTGSPLVPGRVVPVLQRRPDAAREAEAIDRGRRSQCLKAMQFDAAPLEAAFLQDIARRRVGDPRARHQMLDIELLEGEIDH